MSYRLHPAADTELADAVAFYQREAGSGVAKRFLDEFERVAALLVEQPELGTPTKDGRRAFPLHGFPYSIIYRSLRSELRVLVLRHQHRDPAHGQNRS